jgi:WG containing repeat
VIATLLLTGCVASNLVDVGGPSNPNADSSIIPKEGSNGKWGYVDRNGKWLIEPKFLAAYAFTDNLFDKHDGEAMVQVGDKTVYIDKSGKTISEAYPNPN